MFATVSDMFRGRKSYGSEATRDESDCRDDHGQSSTFSRRWAVTYRSRKEINPAQPTAFGLIAEEVAEVNPDLVVRNYKGQPESVHYQMVNVMLLNEFLKEHRHVQE